MMADSPMLKAALAYAKKGKKVFPIKPRGKAPLTPHGFKNATIDPQQIRSWWTQWPEANIGMPTGKVACPPGAAPGGTPAGGRHPSFIGRYVRHPPGILEADRGARLWRLYGTKTNRAGAR